MQGRKNLFNALISSFLFSSFLVPYTSGMEGAESKSNVNGQKESKESFDSSNCSGVTGETINEFKSLDEYILENKDSISEEDFIFIITKVCSTALNECKKDEQKGYLLYKHVSSQSIKIRKSKEGIEVRIDDRYNTHADNLTTSFWIIKMLKHFAGIKPLRHNENFPSDEKTFKIFSNFHCINKILSDIKDYDLHSFSEWKKSGTKVWIGSLLNALNRAYFRGYYRVYS